MPGPQVTPLPEQSCPTTPAAKKARQRREIIGKLETAAVFRCRLSSFTNYKCRAANAEHHELQGDGCFVLWITWDGDGQVLLQEKNAWKFGRCPVLQLKAFICFKCISLSAMQRWRTVKVKCATHAGPGNSVCGRTDVLFARDSRRPPVPWEHSNGTVSKQNSFIHLCMYVRTYVCFVSYCILYCHVIYCHVMRCDAMERNAMQFMNVFYYIHIYIYISYRLYLHIAEREHYDNTYCPRVFFVHWVSLPPTFSAPSSLAARLTSVVRVRAMVFSSLHWSFVTSCQRTTSVESIGSPKKIEQIQLKW